MKFEVRNTTLQSKLTLNNYSSNGKLAAEWFLVSSSFTLSYVIFQKLMKARGRGPSAFIVLECLKSR